MHGAGVILLACLVAGLQALRVDPVLFSTLELGSICSRSAKSDNFYQILITFEEDKDRTLGGVAQVSAQAFASRQEHGMWVYANLREANENSISMLEKELSTFAGWRSIKRYLVSNSWLISANREVIKFLISKEKIIAEIFWDRPFQVKGIKQYADGSRDEDGLGGDITDGNQKEKDDEYLFESSAAKLDDETVAEWNIRWIGASKVWDITTGVDMIYASADTGVDWRHPILEPRYAAHLWSNGGKKIRHDYAWWDGIRATVDEFKFSAKPKISECPKSSAKPCDDSGHGTHTTSTAGNNPDPGKRPHVIGNSYGCPHETEGCATWAFHKAITALKAAGIVMVVSSGNSGPACGSMTAPPAYEPEVLTIGATSYKSNEVAVFSSRGPAPSYLPQSTRMSRMKPELVAPGVEIRGAYKYSSYMTLSGTSMAAPHVAGAILLIYSACPHLVRNIDELEKLMLSTAKRLLVTSEKMVCGGEAPKSYPNCVYGYGMLRADVAVRKCLELQTSLQ